MLYAGTGPTTGASMVRVITDRQDDSLQLLKEHLATISDLYSAASVLAWDRQTYMPEGGVLVVQAGPAAKTGRTISGWEGTASAGVAGLAMEISAGPRTTRIRSSRRVTLRWQG